MLHVLLLSVVIVGSGQLGPTAKKVVGNWRYDLKTLRVEFAPDVKKKLAKAKPNEKKQYDAAMASLKNLIAGLRLEFRNDHTFFLRMKDRPNSKKGKWSLAGKSITVTMNEGMMKQPKMTLSNDYKTIKTASVFPGLGTGYVTLVRN